MRWCAIVLAAILAAATLCADQSRLRLVVAVPPPALPSAPTGLAPACGATSVSINPTLSFTSAGATSYAIKFNAFNPPTSVVASTFTYAASSLSNSTTYYWIATGTNVTGSTASSVCSFTTVAGGGAGEYDITAASAGCGGGIGDSPTGRNPRFLWTCARQLVWDQMEADYNANPSNPATNGGKWFKAVRAMALNVPEDGLPNQNLNITNVGQWNAWLYQVTGDSTWLTAPLYGMYVKLDDHYLSEARIPTAATAWEGWDPNESRIFNELELVMLEWTWPALTQARREAWLLKIVNDSQHAWTSYGMSTDRMHDSDQITGQFYFPVAMTHVVWPGNTTNETLYANAFMGGLTATATDHATIRNQLKWLVTVASAGGEWPESNEYNLTTLPYILMGAEAIHTATGVDYFPELTTWWSDLALRLMGFVTPDLDAYFQWGPEENPRNFITQRMSALTGAVAGLLQGSATGQQLQQFMLDLIAEHGATGNPICGVCGSATMQPFADNYLGLFLWNPNATAAAWKINANRTYWGAGQGVLIAKSGFSDTDTSVMFHCAPLWLEVGGTGNYGIDHHPDYVGDIQAYTNGEHVLTHPFGYDGANSFGEGSNVMRLNGFGAPWEYRKCNDANYGTTHAYLSVTAGGSVTNQGYAGQPPVNTMENTRDALYVPGTVNTVIVHDRAHATAVVADSTDLLKYNFPDCDFPPARWFITNLHSRQEWIWHTPVPATFASGAYTWDTPTTSQHVKWTPLLPASLTRNEYDLDTGFYNSDPAVARCGWYLMNAIYTGLLGTPHTDWKINKLWPSSLGNFHTYLNVFQWKSAAGSPTTPTVVSDAGKAECALVVTSGQNDILACFNSTASAALNTTAYHASHAAALDVVRYRSTGFTITYTATATTTEWYVADLDPTKTWTYTLDGGGSVALSKDAGGFVRTTLSGSGAHTLVVTGA